jgi:hypothetical protein
VVKILVGDFYLFDREFDRVDHCPGSSSETGLIAQAKVYGNWLASSPAVIVVNNASVLA